ncbi:myosin-binding protein 3 [Setaria italica]|uniref:myosin-binding protein 3 n=1 Tax=Setaria italica TaxID=4555 RepID=UPI000350FD3D|nr:myosin-binding protein 3 [Setaria italica]
MAENDTTQLQRAIFAQYIMMKKLFMELEVEREASATAASAAMSMIRKLQKEKDAERMEAWQYKRITEEKMNHTDRALEILKEVMELKELEISYLRNQLQAYKHKLLDAGIDDSDIADETMAGNIPLFESKNVENLCRNLKRNFSLPTLRLNKLYTDMDIKKNGGVQSARSRPNDEGWEHISTDGMALETKKSLSTDVDCTEKQSEEPKSPSTALHDSQPLDESSGCSSFSVVSHQTDIFSERAVQVKEDVEYTVNHDRPKDSCLGTEMGELAVHPLSEVGSLQIPETSNATTDSPCTESEIVTEESELSPAVVAKGRGPRLSRFAATRKIGSMNNVDRHARRSSWSQTPRAGVERTRSRLKRVQSEKMVELNDPRTNKEQIIMLKEVYEQLGMIESHMRPDSQESPRNDTSLDSVLEAALSFSI